MTTINYSYKKQEKTAVALIGANRPHYLKSVVDSIAPQLESRPFYLFIDITPDGNKDVQDEQIEYVLDKIPDANIVRHREHVGLGKNMIGARRYIFSWERYDRAFILEDDLSLTKNYFALCENMMDWCESNYPNVGVVQGWNEIDESKEKSPYRLAATHHHWWGYLQSRRSYLMIKQILDTYEELFLSGLDNYRQRNHMEIMKWKNYIFQNSKKNRDEYRDEFFPRFEEDVLIRKISKDMVSGQDGVTMMALTLTNQARVAPVISRGKYIGQKGEHFNASIYKKYGFEDKPSYESDNDLTQREFYV